MALFLLLSFLSLFFIILLTFFAVKTGLFMKLSHLLTKTGVHLLIKLINKNYWVLAYDLLQTLNRYVFNKDEYTVGFVFVSVEIYIANYKPLKAYELIKRYNLINGNVHKWKIYSTNIEKDIKIHRNIMRILHDSLSYFYPEYAYELFKNIIDDQKNIFYPVDLSYAITDIINNLYYLNQNNDDGLFIELAELILSQNLIVHQKALRALIIEVFKKDENLSRRLFKYARKVGVYTTVQYRPNSAATLTINTDLSEEEMYLLMSESLKLLKEKIDCNIFILQPRTLLFYLNFEIIPTEKMLYEDTISNQKNNINLIKSAKQLMIKVFNKFDPKLRTSTRATSQRVCRMMGSTIFPHLIKEEINP